MLTPRALLVILSFFAFSLGGCALSLGQVSPLTSVTPREADTLNQAVQAYYSATTATEMRRAVARALDAGEGAAMAHEIAADLARFEDDTPRQVNHLIEALADTQSDATELHLLALQGLNLTRPERRRVLARTLQLSESHPLVAVQSAAAAFAVHLLGQEAEYDAMDRLRASKLPTLPVALIGTWDNDQGKGFETARPPEEGVDLSARYPGTVVEIAWRTSAPLTRRGNYNLDALLSPSAWATAYASAVVEAEDAGPRVLRMATTSPFKVWLNGQLVASVEERRPVSAFDGFVLPLDLRQGPNRLLIKLAHRQGGWALRPRLTAPDGVGDPGISLTDPGTEVAPSTGAPPKVWGAEDFISARTKALAGPEVRRALLSALWAEQLGLQSEAIGLVENLVSTHPGAIVPTYLLGGLHWDHQERGQAADLLGRLDRDHGAELAFLRGQQARFWLQQGRKDQARDHLLALRDTRPESATTWTRLADYFKEEGWPQERCAALEEANQRRPHWPHGLRELGRCQQRLMGAPMGTKTLERALDEMPGSHAILKDLRQASRGLERWSSALGFVQRMVRGWPNSYSARIHLGDIYRRMGDHKAARRAYERALGIDPDASWAHKRLGALAREAGDIEGAVEAWQDSVTRNPDDDKLARYVQYHEAGPQEAWLADVPDADAIDQAIAKGRAAPAVAGADAVALIDHRVVRLYADGSRSGVVTQVVLAVNEQGRDRVTSMLLGERGKVQVLQAYASNPDGSRVEATRPRDGKVRFRALQDGSVAVLQFRFDSGPQPYLALHLAEMWSFHAVGWASAWSEWVLWLGADEVVHEQGLGDYTRGEAVHGDLKRVHWTMVDAPPVIPEPGAPSHLEVLSHVMVSTVPSWETFMRWEAALLAGVFRSDPHIEALAKRLVKDSDSPQARVLALHDYVMNEIRYEQDYENTIAGVKPHAAPVVLERRYGDCKDKTVLFITLARLVGVDAHFAILKTRPKGPVYQKVPYQQFDHAIVYVPSQPGIPEGRFYDPTSDAMDLEVLRQDDAGAMALVYDPRRETHTWIPIPFQTPSAHHASFSIDFTLNPDGSAQGVLTVTGRGTMGSRLRRGARNRAKFDKWIEGLIGVLAPGASVDTITVLEVADLTKDAALRATFSAPDIAQLRGKEATLSLPWTRLYRVSPSYKLPTRRYPLLRGVPEEVELKLSYRLSKGSKVITLPESARIQTACTTFVRDVSKTGRQVTLNATLTRRCERINPENYGEQRRAAKRTDELNSEVIVLKLR